MAQSSEQRSRPSERGEDTPWLPPGFRFHPTDEELVSYYLTGKVVNINFAVQAIAEVDLNKCEPWDLPAKAKMGEKEWYFFSLRDRKYPTGMRTNRATEAGYWKATGKDREVMNGRCARLVGMKKTLVFYKGRAPKGEKTNWIMHEYRIEGESTPLIHSPKVSKDEWVVCRIFQKSGGGGKSKDCSRSSMSYNPDPQARSSLPALLESPNPNSVEDSDTCLLDGGFNHPIEHLKSSNWPLTQSLDNPPSKNTLVRLPSYLDMYSGDGGGSNLKSNSMGTFKLCRQDSLNLQQAHLSNFSLKYLDNQSASSRGFNSMRPCKMEPYVGEEDEAQSSQRMMECPWVGDNSFNNCEGGALPSLTNESCVSEGLCGDNPSIFRTFNARGFLPELASQGDLVEGLWGY